MEAAPDAPPTDPPPRLARLALHLLIAWHLFAIVVAPSTVPPSSQVQRSAFAVASPYLETLNLNHGYHYFAPDPGESRLIEYELADGTVGRLPDRAIRPRLLYHRYFMLTDSQPHAGDDPAAAATHYAALTDGVTRHVGERPVELRRVTHRLARPQFIRGGFRLDDPQQYLIEPTAPRGPVTLPSTPPSALPLPEAADE